jgi:hypothetical protein
LREPEECLAAHLGIGILTTQNCQPLDGPGGRAQGEGESDVSLDIRISLGVEEAIQDFQAGLTPCLPEPEDGLFP